MAKGWSSSVWRLDGEDGEEYVGFFESDDEANKWIKKQKVGTYEVRQRRAKT